MLESPHHSHSALLGGSVPGDLFSHSSDGLPQTDQLFSSVEHNVLRCSGASYFCRNFPRQSFRWKNLIKFYQLEKLNLEYLLFVMCMWKMSQVLCVYVKSNTSKAKVRGRK